jgi:transposase-like protein
MVARIADEVIARARRLITEGQHTRSDVARLCGISLSALSRHLAREPALPQPAPPKRRSEPDIALSLRLPTPTARLLTESAVRRGMTVEQAALKAITWIFYRGAPSKVFDADLDPRTVGSRNGLKNSPPSENAGQLAEV